jgi:hypothetical protein
LVGCGQPTNQQYNLGFALHLAASNVGVGSPLPAGQPIELAFDRLLLPITVTRQSFTLVDQAMPTNGILFSIAYDPVARVVTINPLTALSANHSYVLSMISPTHPTDPSGLHAIDGATMDLNAPRTITFQVVAAAAAPPAMCGASVGPCIDFCKSIVPILVNDCVSGSCHQATSPPMAAVGLQVGNPQPGPSLLATAIGRIAVGDRPNRRGIGDGSVVDAVGDPHGSLSARHAHHRRDKPARCACWDG